MSEEEGEHDHRHKDGSAPAAGVDRDDDDAPDLDKDVRKATTVLDETRRRRWRMPRRKRTRGMGKSRVPGMLRTGRQQSAGARKKDMRVVEAASSARCSVGNRLGADLVAVLGQHGP
jgi:hypothetical protein